MKKLLGILFTLTLSFLLFVLVVTKLNPSSGTDFDPDSCTDYYYLSLDETEKEAYIAVRSEIYSFPKEIETPILTSKQLGNVLYALLYDDPMLFMFDTCKLETEDGVGYFIPNYTLTEDEYYDYEYAINQKLDEIAETIPESDYEIELYCHDYVVNNCTYTDEGAFYEDNPIGVFIENKAKCAGYSKAFKVLLDRFGIDCVLISGMATNSSQKTDSHMWTAVKISGSWCYNDPTWDDPTSESGEEVCRYDYFNLTEDMLRKTHSDFEFSNECNSAHLYYYIRYNRCFDSCDEGTHLQIAELISDAAKNDNTSITIMFTSAYVKEQAFNCLITEQNIYRILEKASLASEIPFATNKISYFVNDDKNLVTFYFKPKE